MKTITRYIWAILNICSGLFLSAVFYWTIPYNELKMIDLSFILKWLVSAFVVGMAGVYFYKKNLFAAAVLTTVGFVLAVIFRVIFDLLHDPTTHNLFPFEIMLAILIAFPFSLIGAFVSAYFFKKDKNISED